MSEFVDFNGTEDLTNRRSVTIGDNKLNFTRTDPYGFWIISYEKGQLPRELTGVYTSFQNALKEAQSYIVKKQKEAEPKPASSRPTIKYKKTAKVTQEVNAA